ncbi:MAG: hypothetical protein HKO59_17425 [Phycisphaerales bacterium]|nr:FUSC family protein [Phycisphaerae bacterium]NNF42156.1 hypothetical protein [Phycisphaerales bacterium]NNM27728.1 hypothetical protein [Phycisphaerales bacterium]
MPNPFSDITKDDVRDATRLAIQSAVSAAALFVAMKSLDMGERFVGVLTAVFVVQTTVGTAMTTAWNRTASSVCGCVIGIVALAVLPDGYGTAGALAGSMLLMNGIGGLWPEWRYGVVAAVALALGSDENVVQTAIDRTLAIGLGVVVGFVVTITIWPEKASTRARRNTDRAVRALGEYVAGVMMSARGEERTGRKRTREARDRYESRMNTARDSVAHVRIADDEALQTRIDAARRLYHAIAIVDRVSAEAGDLTTDDDTLADRIETVRERLTTLIQTIAGDEEASADDPRTQLEAVRAIIDECGAASRDSATEDRDTPAEGTLRPALIFGLCEIEESLERLVDAG